MGFFRLFGKATHKHEDEDIVRIDLSDRQYGSLMRSLERDDIADSTIKVYVEARLKKDEKGYFLRLPYPDAQLIYGTLKLLRKRVANQSLQDMQDWVASMKKPENKQQQGMDEPVKVYETYRATSEQEADLRELLEVFQYQMCPEEYHPFGPR